MDRHDFIDLDRVGNVARVLAFSGDSRAARAMAVCSNGRTRGHRNRRFVCSRVSRVLLNTAPFRVTGRHRQGLHQQSRGAGPFDTGHRPAGNRLETLIHNILFNIL